MAIQVLIWKVFFSSIAYLTITIQAQNGLSGSKPFAVVDGNYRLKCDISDSAFAEFLKDGVTVCQIRINVRSGCTLPINSPISSRYECGCIDNKTVYLNITNIVKDDEVTWTCKYYSGGFRMISKTIPVHEYYGPDEVIILPRDSVIPLAEGSDKVLTCTAECDPPCNFTWSGPVSSKTERLVLRQGTRSQDGIYTCEATNNKTNKTLSKTVQVIIVSFPTITELSSTAENNIVDAGSDVIFKCNVESSTLPHITWSSTYYADMGTGHQWTLKNTTCEDSSTYMCTVTDNLGQTVVQSLPLYVRCPPKISGNFKDEYPTRLGERVTLKINIEAYPEPTFKWKKVETNRVLPNAQIQKIAEAHFQSTLEITVDESSFGYYIITVQNAYNGKCNVETWIIKIVDKDALKPEVKRESKSEVSIEHLKSATKRNLAEIELIKLEKRKLELEIEVLAGSKKNSN